ncbi:hypothetical protein GF407_04230 [candidate division KSB1 bacterium]|nr:hypothetical protein [candidate division KSB1 bacterium]
MTATGYPVDACAIHLAKRLPGRENSGNLSPSIPGAGWTVQAYVDYADQRP